MRLGWLTRMAAAPLHWPNADDNRDDAPGDSPSLDYRGRPYLSITRTAGQTREALSGPTVVPGSPGPRSSTDNNTDGASFDSAAKMVGRHAWHDGRVRSPKLVELDALFPGMPPIPSPGPEDTQQFSIAQCRECLEDQHLWSEPGRERIEDHTIDRYRCDCDHCYGRCGARRTRVLSPDTSGLRHLRPDAAD